MCGLELRPHTRLLSITFDDGLHYGAQVAEEILRRRSQKATFFIVTGWVHPERTVIRDRFNAGRSHGDWEFWRRMAAQGHEIGSHTFSHINASGRIARVMPWIVKQEMERSLSDLGREVSQNSYTVSMPWNAATRHSEALAKKLYAACRLGTAHLNYNSIADLRPQSLTSWAPNTQTSISEYRSALQSIPAGGWLILQFHSFDDEGWEPLRRETFDAICQFASEEPDLQVATVGDVMRSCM